MKNNKRNSRENEWLALRSGTPGFTIQRKEREQRKKDEREKPLLFKRHKAVRFLISPKIKKVKIEVNKIMNPAFLL